MRRASWPHARTRQNRQVGGRLSACCSWQSCAQASTAVFGHFALGRVRHERHVVELDIPSVPDDAACKLARLLVGTDKLHLLAPRKGEALRVRQAAHRSFGAALPLVDGVRAAERAHRRVRHPRLTACALLPRTEQTLVRARAPFLQLVNRASERERAAVELGIVARDIRRPVGQRLRLEPIFRLQIDVLPVQVEVDPDRKLGDARCRFQ
mmetsp:Transcript_13036/g.25263  ORF Transcript_13036/g.25263 Transcript_13036/m.25263 type:complete len:210 (+) Transcript_13036:375-1004(+)